MLPSGSSIPDRGGARWRSADFLVLALCIAAALVVRWPRLSHDLSFDEIWHLSASAGRAQSSVLTWKADVLHPAPNSPTALEDADSLQAVWTKGIPMHPPLHALSLRLWREAFGDSDYTASLYSTVWSLAAICFLFAAVRLQAGTGLASCAALTMAVSPVQADLGTEVRGYAMLIGLTSCAVWQAIRIEQFGATPRRAWLLGLSTCPLMLTEYFAIGPCLAIGIWAILTLSRAPRRHFIVSVGAAALIFLVACGPIAWGHLGRTNLLGFLKTDEPFWQGSGLMATDLPLRLLVYPRWRPVAAAGSMALLVITLLGVRRSTRVLHWALMLIVPIATLLVLDVVQGAKQTAFVRYAAAASIGIPAAPALAAFVWRETAGWCLGWALVAVTVAGSGSPRDIGSPYFHHMQKALRATISAGPSERPIVALRQKAGNQQFYAKAILLQWSHAPGIFPRPAMLLQDAPEAALSDRARATRDGRFWLLTHDLPVEESDPPAWLQKLLPAAHLVQPPLLVPAAGRGISPQPAVTLWLLEMED
jgi:hypothetical protein